MKIRMKGDVSGARNGKPWPSRGETLDVPDGEGADLCASGIAEPVASRPAAETAVVPDDVEKRPAPEAAVVEPAPEQAVEPKPAPARKSAPRKAPARKTAADKD